MPFLRRFLAFIARHPTVALWAFAFILERIAHPGATRGGPVATIMFIIPMLAVLGAAFGAGVELVFEIREVASHFVGRVGAAVVTAAVAFLYAANNNGFDGMGWRLGFQFWAFLILLISLGWEMIEPLWTVADFGADPAAAAVTEVTDSREPHPSGPFLMAGPGGPCVILPRPASLDQGPQPSFTATRKSVGDGWWGDE